MCGDVRSMEGVASKKVSCSVVLKSTSRGSTDDSSVGRLNKRSNWLSIHALPVFYTLWAVKWVALTLLSLDIRERIAAC
jgi:hypothetical protein